MRRVYVASVGLIRVGRHYGKDLVDLALDAASQALASVDIEPQLIIASSMLAETLQEQSLLASKIASNLGLRYRPAIRVETGQSSGLAAVYTAYAFVASGLAEAALVVGVEKLTDYPSAIVNKALGLSLDSDYESYYGITPAAIAGLSMRYYMEKYGVSRDELSEWPVMMHTNAAENPFAQIRRRVTKEDVQRSQIVSDPIRVLDTSPVGDGAAAIVLASEDLARRQGIDGLVELAGFGLASDDTVLSIRGDLDTIPTARLAVEQALSRAKTEINDIDVVELHDEYTITAMLLLEESGLAEKGKAAKMLAEGRFHPGDKPTVNPSGGLKARGHPVGATGVYQVAEVTMQLRGDFPGVRVSGAENGLVISLGGLGSSAIACVVRRA